MVGEATVNGILHRYHDGAFNVLAVKEVAVWILGRLIIAPPYQYDPSVGENTERKVQLDYHCPATMCIGHSCIILDTFLDTPEDIDAF